MYINRSITSSELERERERWRRERGGGERGGGKRGGGERESEGWIFTSLLYDVGDDGTF